MKKPLQLLTIGVDAEVFLKLKNSDEVISAEGLVKGSKYKPFRFDKATSKWFTTQLDNVLLEFTIPPTNKVREFVQYINKAMNYAKSTLPDNVEPLIQASACLDEKYLQTEQAQMFGCDPDFNAYTKFMNYKPECEDHTLRSCGSHIHIGYNGVEVPFKDDEIYNYNVDEQRARLIQAMDLFVSVPLVLMEPDSERKRLYGKAGAFRPKPYGVEYRTTSNWYLTSPKTMRWAFAATKRAFKYFKDTPIMPAGVPEHVQEVINNNDKAAARDLVADFNLTVV